MKDNESIDIVILFLAMIITSAVVVGFLIDDHWKGLSIKHNFAEYNQITGVWQWKTNVVITNFITVTNVVNK